MRDLLFKNLTSEDKKRRVISSSEIVQRQGVRSVIRRHFLCVIRETKKNQLNPPLPYVYVLKEHNNKEQRQRFFCKLKGSIYAVNNERLFLICFTHSLKIDLIAIPAESVKEKEN